MSEQCCDISKQCRSNVEALRCAENHWYDLSRVTSVHRTAKRKGGTCIMVYVKMANSCKEQDVLHRFGIL